ncbi:hypothetical protein GC176_26270 [bacterium]|nr:hypothetical protein [bacterium]
MSGCPFGHPGLPPAWGNAATGAWIVSSQNRRCSFTETNLRFWSSTWISCEPRIGSRCILLEIVVCPVPAILTQSTTQLADSARCVHIGDRESDIYELFCTAQRQNTHFLVRTCVDRLPQDFIQHLVDRPLKPVDRV